MKQILKIMSLIAVLSGLTVATQAQTVVWSQNFDSLTLGAYGQHLQDFINDPTVPALPANNIVIDGSGQAMALTFNASNTININLQSATASYAAVGNTSASLADYTLSFDLAVTGAGLQANQGLEIGVFGDGSWIWWGNGSSIDLTTGLPVAGTGYQHFSLPLSSFHADAAALNPTDASMFVSMGVVNYGNNMTAFPETLLLDNVEITLVPEPSTFAMLLGGLGLFAGWRRYRRA